MKSVNDICSAQNHMVWSRKIIPRIRKVVFCEDKTVDGRYRHSRLLTRNYCILFPAHLYILGSTGQCLARFISSSDQQKLVNLSEMSNQMGCYSIIILTCECIRPNGFIRLTIKPQNSKDIPEKIKSFMYYIKMQIWCHFPAIVLIKFSTKPPHIKKIFPIVLKTQCLCILPSETESVSITDETSMAPNCEHPL